MKFQALRERFIVTEWRDGCVYKTKPNGFVFVTLDSPADTYQAGDTIYASIGTRLTSVYDTMRRVPDDTPDIVEVELKDVRKWPEKPNGQWVCKEHARRIGRRR